MSISRTLLMAGLFLIPAAVMAQETGQREKARQPGREPGARNDSRTETRTEGRADAARTGQHDNQLNKHFVSCLRIDNQGEIAISKIGEQKASNPEVKAFAQQMVKDHTDFLAKLDRLNQGDTSRPAPGAARTDAANPNASDAGARGTNDTPRPNQGEAGRRNADATPGARADVRVDTNRGDATGAAAGHGMSGVHDQLVRIKQEIGDRCVATKTKELNEKQGNDFDKCFMFSQVAAHMHMVDTLSVLKNHASGEVQKVIDEGLQTSQQHLEHAKQLAKKVDTGSSSDDASTSTERATNRKSDANSESNRTEGDRRRDKAGNDSGKNDRGTDSPK